MPIYFIPMKISNTMLKSSLWEHKYLSMKGERDNIFNASGSYRSCPCSSFRSCPCSSNNLTSYDHNSMQVQSHTSTLPPKASLKLINAHNIGRDRTTDGNGVFQGLKKDSMNKHTGVIILKPIIVCHN